MELIIIIIIIIIIIVVPKMEAPRRTWHKESKKQMVLLYNSTQYGETTIYPLRPNFISSVAM